eukprot:TRINITY_DN14978_c0_g1_i1.p2 TRINITY_DN14978_c0_g1~~TRINITY_DN14978_c0_g1_i1.p2  ORF type:complete len:72 (+),score=6.72 TRINITY_DN14978_c0_g1_i1:73-288(+)
MTGIKTTPSDILPNHTGKKQTTVKETASAFSDATMTVAFFSGKQNSEERTADIIEHHENNMNDCRERHYNK